MEFYINFGIPGLIIGFLLLGWVLGTLDRKAAIAEARGDLSKTVLFFLPAVALIQPNGSLVELSGGCVAALAAAYGWSFAWKTWRGNIRSSDLDVSQPPSLTGTKRWLQSAMPPQE